MKQRSRNNAKFTLPPYTPSSTSLIDGASRYALTRRGWNGGIDDELRRPHGLDLPTGTEPGPVRHPRRPGHGPAGILTLVYGGRLSVRASARAGRDDPWHGRIDRLRPGAELRADQDVVPSPRSSSICSASSRGWLLA